MSNAKNKKQKYWLYGLIFLAIVLLIIGSTRWQNTPHQKSNKTDFLHVEGNKVLDENDNKIYLRGFNVPFRYRSFKDNPEVYENYTLEEINQWNRELFNAYITEDDIKNMRDMGANVVRKQLSFYDFETEPYKYNDGVLQVLDDLVEKSYKNDVYVIIAMDHAAQSVTGSNIEEYEDASKLWSDEEWRQRVISAWVYIAEHYVDNPGIAGYDIINEPEPPNREALHSFYSDSIQEIRKVDKNHTIILQNKHFPQELDILFGGNYEDSNIMLSPHYYNDAGENINKTDPEVTPWTYNTKEELEAVFSAILSHEDVKEKNRPLYVGEFSALTASGDEGLRWTRDIIDVFNKNGIHYTYFQYKNIFGMWIYRGLYQYRKGSVFRDNNWNSLPLSEVKGNLLTKNFKHFPEVRQILEEAFREPYNK